MNYHWEWINADLLALFEQGATWTGGIPLLGTGATIHKMGPFLVPNPKVTYRASGLLVDPPQEFGSFQEAMRAVEAIATAAGHTIVRP